MKDDKQNKDEKHGPCGFCVGERWRESTAVKLRSTVWELALVLFKLIDFDLTRLLHYL